MAAAGALDHQTLDVERSAGQAPSPRLLYQDGVAQQLLTFPVLRGIARFGEFSVIGLLSLLIAALYLPLTTLTAGPHYFIAAAGTSLLAVVIFDLLGLYRQPALLNAPRQFPRVLFGWALAMSVTVAAIFFLKNGAEFSRVWVATWFVATAATLLAARVWLGSVARVWIERGALARRAVIYGGGAAGEALLRALEADKSADVRVFGVFDDRGDERVPNIVAGYPKLGSVDDLVAYCRENRVDMIFLTLPITAEAKLREITEKLRVLPVDIRLSVESTALKFRPRAYSRVGNVPVLDLHDKPMGEWGLIAKSCLDKVIAACALIALAPLMLAVAAAVRWGSKGPVLFRQQRYGFNNELIEVFKFRSMYTDMSDAKAAKLVTKDDPRVTPIGRIIRKTSIDELPQLFNVLRGELSLVGPRPHALHAKAAEKLYDEAVDGYFARHRVKPGITGWAQIHGWRGETDTHEKIQKRVEHDIYYIDNWSIWLDLYILIRTPLALLDTRNAY